MDADDAGPAATEARAVTWRQVAPGLLDRLKHTVTTDPQQMFDGKGGTVHVGAHVLFAWLVDHDGHEDDVHRIRYITPIYRPGPARASMANLADRLAGNALPATEWHLQSAYAVAEIEWRHAPPDIASRQPPADGQARIALLRYQRPPSP